MKRLNDGKIQKMHKETQRFNTRPIQIGACRPNTAQTQRNVEALTEQNNRSKTQAQQKCRLHRSWVFSIQFNSVGS